MRLEALDIAERQTARSAQDIAERQAARSRSKLTHDRETATRTIEAAGGGTVTLPGEALLPSAACWVATRPEDPDTIVAASRSWCALWKFPMEEAVGGSIKCINGEGYDKQATYQLMKKFRESNKALATARCTNVTKTGERVSHDLTLAPHPTRSRAAPGSHAALLPCPLAP